MSKSKKRGRGKGQQSPYKIITESAYQGRGLFKTGAVIMAAGLAVSAVVATAPTTVAKSVTVSLEDAKSPAVVQEITDVSMFYTDDSLVNFRVKEVDEVNRLVEELIILDEETEKTENSVITKDLKSYVSSLSNEEAEEKLEHYRQEQEKARRKAQRAYTTTYNYVGLNASGVPMSQKVPSVPIELDENGVPLHYSYCITGHATAYTADSITSTGTRPVQGTVAVNPRQIPYGTRMYITSADGRYVYGYAVAEDTGGFIYFSNGATVDLFMNSYADCVDWGWRMANIYILD